VVAVLVHDRLPIGVDVAEILGATRLAKVDDANAIIRDRQLYCLARPPTEHSALRWDEEIPTQEPQQEQDAPTT